MAEANYSKGDYYHTYETVGNREAQQKSVLGLVTNDTYVYDDANRLTSVNSVNYTWDNNGNLLNDGTNTYTYDSANRNIDVDGVEYDYDDNGNLKNDGVNEYDYDLASIPL